MPTGDRRTRRTRRQLRDALVSLALERGYTNLTVEDITERADLGRATFYSHYTDKDALLSSIVALPFLNPVATPSSPRNGGGQCGGDCGNVYGSAHPLIRHNA